MFRVNKRPNPGEGLTLIEVMIVVAISSIVGVGLFYLIKSATQIIWSSGAKIELQQNAQEAMYWITTDFKSCSPASIGNVNVNPGFEIPLSPDIPTGVPLGWQNPFPVGATKIGTDNPNLKSGFYALSLFDSSAGSSYESAIATFPVTGAYRLSCWLKVEGSAEVRVLREDGTDFAPAISTGCVSATGTWQYFCKEFNQNGNAKFKIQLRNPNPGFQAYFDDVSVSPLEMVFNETGAALYFPYERFAKLKNERCRLYYDTATLTLHRQIWQSEHWETVAPEPLSKYVRQLAIKNVEQNGFTLKLELAKPARADKEEKYQLQTSIAPLSN